MKKKLKKQWIKALRSGKYTQGPGELCNTQDNTHCCLGVLCEVAIKENHKIIRTKEGHYNLNKKMSVDDRLDKAMLIHFGLDSKTQIQLIEMNDENRLSFKEIANYIEENL